MFTGALNRVEHFTSALYRVEHTWLSYWKCSDIGPYKLLVTFDHCTTTGQPALIAVITGAPARGWSERPESERRIFVLDTLVGYFGESARHPTHYVGADWAWEPYIGGAPVATVSPGTLSVFDPALRCPVGWVHWAGTETALVSTGFMEGALESGARTAEEVLTALHGATAQFSVSNTSAS